MCSAERQTAKASVRLSSLTDLAPLAAFVRLESLTYQRQFKKYYIPFISDWHR